VHLNSKLKLAHRLNVMTKLMNKDMLQHGSMMKQPSTQAWNNFQLRKTQTIGQNFYSS